MVTWPWTKTTRMWADAQRDDRRAEYRWRPLLNAAKFLSGRRSDVYHTSTHGVGPSAYLECRSTMCCMRLAGNTWRENRHFATMAQLCRATSLELRHVSTIGKKLLNSNTSFACPDNMVNFGILTAEICWRVWGTPANLNGFGSSSIVFTRLPHLLSRYP